MPDEYRIGRLNGGLVVSWWEDGKRRRYRLDACTRKEAEVEAVSVINRVRAKPAGPTIGDLWEAYRKEMQGRKIALTMEYEWRVMATFFGNMTAEALTVDHCRAYRDVRRTMVTKVGKKAHRKGRTVHDGTIWTELGHLRTVLVWAHKRRLIAYAPMVERPSKPHPKDRWLTRPEIDRLLAAPKAHHIQIAILLMLSTAGRIGAILELKWERVDFDNGHVNLRTTETGPRKGRAIVPMNDGLRAALSHARAGALSDYVVEWAGQPVKSIKTGFRKACAEAGLVDVTPHTMRHTAAVHLAADGVKMERIAQYLGHSDSRVTEKVYARFAPDHLKEEAAILDFTRPTLVV